MQELISRTELAQRARVSKAAITKACNKNLADAVVGKRVDASHPLVVEYLQNREEPLTVKIDGRSNPIHLAGHGSAKQRKKDLSRVGEDTPFIPENIRAFVDMPLRKIINEYGTDIAFVDWLKAVKEIEIIYERQLKNATTASNLVARELVEVSIIGPMNTAHTQMLTDGAKTIARRAVAMTKAGDPVEDIELLVSEQIGSFIKPLKKKMKACLKK